MVNAGYVNGVPPHRLPSAMDRDHNLAASCVFVVRWDQFKAMTASEIQAQFRYRHILVLDAPVETLDFNQDGLETVGSIHATRTVHGV